MPHNHQPPQLPERDPVDLAVTITVVIIETLRLVFDIYLAGLQRGWW